MMNLMKNFSQFSKEFKSTEMPPPSDPPPSVERLGFEATTRSKDYEESSSACSGSLLGNLVCITIFRIYLSAKLRKPKGQKKFKCMEYSDFYNHSNWKKIYGGLQKLLRTLNNCIANGSRLCSFRINPLFLKI